MRNFQPPPNMKKMKIGDRCFFYHSVGAREIVGILEVVREYYPDHTDKSGRFGMVDVKAVAPLTTPVTLARIKADERLGHLALVRQPRLSVLPIDEPSWRLICELGGVRAMTGGAQARRRAQRPCPGVVLGRLDDIPDGGTKLFSFGKGFERFQMFVLRRGDRLLSYANDCPHVHGPLDWRPGEFLTEDGEHIICAMHGAGVPARRRPVRRRPVPRRASRGRCGRGGGGRGDRRRHPRRRRAPAPVPPPVPALAVLIPVLGALSAFAPMSIDMYLPSTDHLVTVFATSSARVQWTLSSFILGLRDRPSVLGPVSDRFGRRPLLTLGIGLYSAASLGCLLAPTIEAMVVLRALAGLRRRRPRRCWPAPWCATCSSANAARASCR